MEDINDQHEGQHRGSISPMSLDLAVGAMTGQSIREVDSLGHSPSGFEMVGWTDTNEVNSGLTTGYDSLFGRYPTPERQTDANSPASSCVRASHSHKASYTFIYKHTDNSYSISRMACYRIVQADGTLSTLRRLVDDDGDFPRSSEEDYTDPKYQFVLNSTRVDLRYMDGYMTRGIRGAITLFYDGPFIPWNKMALDNLPPFYRVLSDNQAEHLEAWVRIECTGDKFKEALPGRLLDSFWPSNFDDDGFILWEGVMIGDAFDGDLPPNMTVRQLFEPKKKEKWSRTDEECLERLPGGPIVRRIKGHS